MKQYTAIDDTVYFWFAGNDTSGSGGDGASPAADVRLAGAAADAIPTYSPTPVLLSHANYPAGAYEIAIAATAGNGFATGNTYAVFCTLAIDSQNPTGFVGSFDTKPVESNPTQLGDSAQSLTDLKDFADAGYDPATHKAQSDLIYIHGTALTETDGQLAAGFKKLFDVATPLLVASDVMRGTDSAALAATALTDATWTDARAGYLDELAAANLPTDIADIPTVAEFNARTLSSADYVVTTDTIAGVTTVTNLTNAPTAGDLTATMKTSVNAEADTALTDIHLDHLLAVDYDPASKPGTATALLNELVENDGGVSRYTANALEQAPSGGTNPNVLIDTTISGAPSSQTVFVLAAGSDIDDTYKDQAIVLYDASNNDYPSVRKVSAYTGATKTVTLDSAPDFTIVSGDGVKTFVTAPGTTAPTVGQIRAEMEGVGYFLDLIKDDTNELQTDWVNGGRLDLILDIIAADTTTDIPTLIATAQTDLDTITGSDGVTLATAQALYAPNKVVPDIAGTLATYDPPTNTEMVAAFTEIKGATWAATDSLEAIRDRGDNEWITATGFSTHSAADVKTAIEAGGSSIALILADTGELQGNQGAWATATGFATSGAMTTAQNDLDLLTGADGATLATLQGNYAPNKVVPDVAGTAATLHGVTDGKVDAVDGNVDAILLDTGTDGVVIATGSKTGFSLSATGVDAILDEIIEGTHTMRKIMRLLGAYAVGKSSGGGTASVTFRDIDDTKDRIVATVTEVGNRTDITLTED